MNLKRPYAGALFLVCRIQGVGQTDENGFLPKASIPFRRKVTKLQTTNQ
ncbi:hypothetical protein [Paenibacillus sp. 32O-W]|nr:hypothetical protein [Paenibacillus sp. 32O-W]